MLLIFDLASAVDCENADRLGEDACSMCKGYHWDTQRESCKCKVEKQQLNPFKPEFTIVIFIHYKPLVVDEDDL